MIRVIATVNRDESRQGLEFAPKIERRL